MLGEANCAILIQRHFLELGVLVSQPSVRAICPKGDFSIATEQDKILLELIESAINTEVFPGAVALVAQGGKIVFFEHVGYRSLVPERVPMARDTIFDLASLTKVMATIPAVMKLVDEGRIALNDPLSKLIPSANLGEKKELTLRLLLTHSAGLIDWKPFYREAS